MRHNHSRITQTPAIEDTLPRLEINPGQGGSRAGENVVIEINGLNGPSWGTHYLVLSRLSPVIIEREALLVFFVFDLCSQNVGPK